MDNIELLQKIIDESKNIVFFGGGMQLRKLMRMLGTNKRYRQRQHYRQRYSQCADQPFEFADYHRSSSFAICPAETRKTHIDITQFLHLLLYNQTKQM